MHCMLSERNALLNEQDGLVSKQDGLVSKQDGLVLEPNAFTSLVDGAAADLSSKDNLRIVLNCPIGACPGASLDIDGADHVVG